MDLYEKKYKDALAHAREIHRNEDEKRRDMEFIFPELKESEDEKIRKAILNYLKKMWGNCKDNVCGVHVEDAIAWLEKQGEQKSDWSEGDDRMLHTIIADFKGFSHNNTSTLEPHFNECIDWLKAIKERIGG